MTMTKQEEGGCAPSAACKTKFSVLLSSEENNRSSDLNFYGPYAHIRKTLDYNYHSNYQMQRQWLQDAIVEEFLESVHLTDVNGDVCTTPTEPFIVFTAGAMGAGKSHTINWLVEKGRFPLLSFVGVDPDEIRRRLPEFSLYVELAPERAGELTRKEAGYIAEILTLAALQAGKNVLVDGSLRDSDWYTQYFGRLREEYPNNKIAILHIVAPREAVFQRAADRAKITGRVVPRETLELALEQVPRSVKILAPLADVFYELNNAPGKEIELLTDDEDWDDFQVQWLQMCAWVPGKRKKTFSSRRISSGAEAEENGCREEPAEVDFTEEKKRKFSVAAMRAVPPRPHLDRQFSVKMSTEDNHVSDSMVFYGPYSHIRETLDYTFHKNYCKERQWLQDMILKEIIEGNKETCCPTPEPWLVFAAGVMGAGKIHTVKYLVEKGYLPLSGLVFVDRQKVKSYLPEYAIYVDQDLVKADNLARKEVGYISEIATRASLQAGKNVLVAGTMKAVDWYENKLFPRLREEFPSLRIAILHVVAPREAVFSRLANRAGETGYEVPLERMEAALEQVPKSMEALKPLVDYFCEINNAQGVDPEILSEGETWETFQTKWVQSCAWVPKERRQASIKRK